MTYIVGRNAVLEAIKADVKIEKILILRDIEGSGKQVYKEAKKREISLQSLDRKAMDRILRENDIKAMHQGVIALTSDYKYASVDDILALAKERNEDPFLILLDKIEDPHNLGAIIRIADCAGAHGIIIPKKRSAQVNETVIKVSAGAAMHVKVASVSNLTQTINYLKEQSIWVYGLDMTGSAYDKCDTNGAVALIVGNEGSGLSRLVKEQCDYVVSIPMKGKVGSLNASNAVAVVAMFISSKR